MATDPTATGEVLPNINLPIVDRKRRHSSDSITCVSPTQLQIAKKRDLFCDSSDEGEDFVVEYQCRSSDKLDQSNQYNTTETMSSGLCNNTESTTSGINSLGHLADLINNMQTNLSGQMFSMSGSLEQIQQGLDRNKRSIEINTENIGKLQHDVISASRIADSASQYAGKVAGYLDEYKGAVNININRISEENKILKTEVSDLKRQVDSLMSHKSSTDNTLKQMITYIPSDNMEEKLHMQQQAIERLKARNVADDDSLNEKIRSQQVLIDQLISKDLEREQRGIDITGLTTREESRNTLKLYATMAKELATVKHTRPALERNLIIKGIEYSHNENLYTVLDKICEELHISYDRYEDICQIRRVGLGWFAPIQVCFSNKQIKRKFLDNKWRLKYTSNKNAIWIQHDETKTVRQEKQRILEIAESMNLYVKQVESGLLVDGSFIHNDRLHEVTDDLTLLPSCPAAPNAPGALRSTKELDPNFNSWTTGTVKPVKLVENDSSQKNRLLMNSVGVKDKTDHCVQKEKHITFSDEPMDSDPRDTSINEVSTDDEDEIDDE